MNIIQINSFCWWLIILLNFFAYFIYRFGVISRGNSKVLIEFTGGLFLLASFIMMFLLFGIKNGLILILVFWLMTIPIVEIFIGKIEKKLYGRYFEIEKRIAEKHGMTIEELRKLKNKTDMEILKEVLPDITEAKRTDSLTFKSLACTALKLLSFLVVISTLVFLYFSDRNKSFQTTIKAPTNSPTPTTITSNSKTPLTASETIKLNKNYLVYLICAGDETNIMGSGIIIGKKDNEILVLTNYHIIENFNKNNLAGVPNCFINHWESGEYYYVEPILLESFTKEDMELIDFALLKVLPEPKIKHEQINKDGSSTKIEKPATLLTLNSFPSICLQNEANIGDEIVILGFPAIGGTYIPSLGQVTNFTVTEGIISSEVSDEKWYIKTSAKIDAGNSGGGAFSTKLGCLVGIPTYSTVGQIESMGSMINIRKLLVDYLPSIRGSVFLNF